MLSWLLRKSKPTLSTEELVQQALHSLDKNSTYNIEKTGHGLNITEVKIDPNSTIKWGGAECVPVGIKFEHESYGGRWCYHKGILTDSNWARLNYVEEPLYSFVQLFFKNPKRFSVWYASLLDNLDTGYHLVDTEGKIPSIYVRTPANTLDGKHELKVDDKDFEVVEESILWVITEVTRYYKTRSDKLEKLNAHRKREQLTKLVKQELIS